MSSARTRVVLDASALLALLQRETGQEIVAAALRDDGAAIGAVNLSEVVAKLRDVGAPEEAIERALTAVRARGLEVVGFDEPLALAAGWLRPTTRAAGLSLGDRACLVLARARAEPVLTTDRSWAGLGDTVGVEVRLIR